jgi:hypothetical protein
MPLNLCYPMGVRPRTTTRTASGVSRAVHTEDEALNKVRRSDRTRAIDLLVDRAITDAPS